MVGKGYKTVHNIPWQELNTLANVFLHKRVIYQDKARTACHPGLYHGACRVLDTEIIFVMSLIAHPDAAQKLQQSADRFSLNGSLTALTMRERGMYVMYRAVATLYQKLLTTSE